MQTPEQAAEALRLLGEAQHSNPESFFESLAGQAEEGVEGHEVCTPDGIPAAVRRTRRLHSENGRVHHPKHLLW